MKIRHCSVPGLESVRPQVDLVLTSFVSEGEKNWFSCGMILVSHLQPALLIFEFSGCFKSEAIAQPIRRFCLLDDSLERSLIMLLRLTVGKFSRQMLAALILAVASPVAFAQIDSDGNKSEAGIASLQSDSLAGSDEQGAIDDFGVLGQSEIPEGLLPPGVLTYPPHYPRPVPPRPFPPRPRPPYPPHPPQPYPPYPPQPYPPYPPQPYPPQPYPPYPPQPVMYNCFAQDSYGRGFSARGYDPRGTQNAAMNACYRHSGYGCRPMGCRAY